MTVIRNEPVELLGALCAIDSRTVEGAAGATQVAALLGERLQAMGFTLTWVDPGPEEGPRGRHLQAVRHPDAATRLLLIGHTDTVLSPADVPFRLDAAAGRAYGAGTCDMKGGCVLLLEALRLALADSAAVRAAGLVVLLNAAEEMSGPSFPALARRWGEGARACLGFEPSAAGADAAHAFVIARKGTVRFTLTCRGRAAHAGADHPRGVNAIRELARKIEQIESLTDYAGGVTANVGCISGGRVSNQVADEAVALFEVRAFEPDRLERTCEAVRQICSEPTVRSAADGLPVRLELSEYHSYPPWPPNPGADALARRYEAVARRHGIALAPRRSGGAADTSHVAALAPTLDGLGIRGDGLHSTLEWADTATLPLRARLAADLLTDLCAPDPA